MLNFRNTNILFAVLLIFLIGYDVLYGLPFFAYIILIIAYSLILFYGSYFIQAGFYIKSICSSRTDKKEIAISFDDGPATEYTTAILDILRQNNLQAAFFCIGNRIKENEPIFKSLHEQGHIIGNHSYSHHTWFDLFSSKKMLNDMQMMDKAMKDVIGVEPRLFRPPYGVTNPNLKKAITHGSYVSVGWDVRSYDTVIQDEKKLLHRITGAIKPGSIVLFHDTSKTTLAILPAFLKHLSAEGYAVTRLDKMLKLEAYK